MDLSPSSAVPSTSASTAKGRFVSSMSIDALVGSCPSRRTWPAAPPGSEAGSQGVMAEAVTDAEGIACLPGGDRCGVVWADHRENVFDHDIFYDLSGNGDLHVPSEYSTGEKVKRGSITKAGNGHVRRVLLEAAWSYRFPARVSRALLKRQEGQDKRVQAISWKAQTRLCSRYRRLWAKGKPTQVVVTAIARELCGFMWAIARETEVPTTA